MSVFAFIQSFLEINYVSSKGNFLVLIVLEEEDDQVVLLQQAVV